jgi:hypothetical protein
VTQQIAAFCKGIDKVQAGDGRTTMAGEDGSWVAVWSRPPSDVWARRQSPHASQLLFCSSQR